MQDQRARRDREDANEFAVLLVHRLNNLLQVVNGNLELLESRIEDRQLRGYIRNAQIAAKQLTELADELHGNAVKRPG